MKSYNCTTPASSFVILNLSSFVIPDFSFFVIPGLSRNLTVHNKTIDSCIHRSDRNSEIPAFAGMTQRVRFGIMKQLASLGRLIEMISIQQKDYANNLLKKIKEVLRHEHDY